MSGRERQLWTEFVCKREERRDGKRVSQKRLRKGELSPAEREAALDDLTREAQERLGAPPGCAAG